MSKVEVKRSSCTQCHCECRLLVHIEDGEVIKVEGARDNPITRGFICMKGKASLEYHEHPDRLNYPLKRAGERGGE